MKFTPRFASANIVIVVLLSFGMLACHSNKSSEANDLSATASQDTAAKKIAPKNIFYSIPSPIEIGQLLKSAGATYNKDYLNPVENVSKYVTSNGKALNLGVYGTDLSFTSIFDKSQESMFYLKCTNTLATGLGINGAFGESTTSRVQANMDNKDSLLHIISDAYWAADSYLKDNQRPNTSSMIIAGGWIEGLYIATKIAVSSNNQNIAVRIAEQKSSLQNLISLLQNSSNQDQDIRNLLVQLKELNADFAVLQTTQSKTTVSTDKAHNITTIGNNSKTTITNEQLKTIADKVETIRNNVIKQY
ncbi:MAG: hypothetical protein ABI199_04760 [Bacteroidia bacterium]